MNSVMVTYSRYSINAIFLFYYSISKTSEKFGIYRPTVYNSEENGTNERRKRTGGTTPWGTQEILYNWIMIVRIEATWWWGHLSPTTATKAVENLSITFDSPKT